jgi:hypothetical protein
MMATDTVMKNYLARMTMTAVLATVFGIYTFFDYSR